MTEQVKVIKPVPGVGNQPLRERRVSFLPEKRLGWGGDGLLSQVLPQHPDKVNREAIATVPTKGLL